MKTHDYTNRTWGHDYTIIRIDGNTMLMAGWGYGIKKGDFMILPNEGTTTCYKVKEIEYKSDPKDMWSMTAEFAPRPCDNYTST